MVDVLTAPQQIKADTSLRTLAAISVAHWVSHFHLFVLPMLFPFLKEQLSVGYIELGFALTVFAVVSGLTQAPIGYLTDHIGARKILLIGLTVGGLALILLGMHLSYASLIVCAAPLMDQQFHLGGSLLLFGLLAAAMLATQRVNLACAHRAARKSKLKTTFVRL